jgi:hypothetical protein
MKTQQTTIFEVSLICRSKVKASERPPVKYSKDAYNLFTEQWDHNTIEHIEVFKVMLINRLNVVPGIMDVSKGGISGTVTYVRILLQPSFKANASGFIV